MNDLPIIRCDFGMRGYGKTSLARYMVRARPRLLVHDPMKEHEAQPFEIQDFEDYLDASSLERFRVALITPGEEAYFCAVAWEIGERIGRENELCLSVLLEEADLIAPPGRAPWILKNLPNKCRHIGIEIVAVSRRPAEVSHYLTGNADELNIFHSHEPRDLQYFRQFISREAVDELGHLQKFEFIHWTVGGDWDKRRLIDKTGRWATTSRQGENKNEILDNSPGAVVD